MLKKCRKYLGWISKGRRKQPDHSRPCCKKDDESIDLCSVPLNVVQDFRELEDVMSRKSEKTRETDRKQSIWQVHAYVYSIPDKR